MKSSVVEGWIEWLLGIVFHDHKLKHFEWFSVEPTEASFVFYDKDGGWHRAFSPIGESCEQIER